MTRDTMTYGLTFLFKQKVVCLDDFKLFIGILLL